MKLSGWGRFPVHDCTLVSPRTLDELVVQVSAGNAIARGNGRAYGDSALSRDNTISMAHFNRMIAFDDETGQLVAEGGVLLSDIISAFLPRGWFPSVTPGTKYVTLGGMIAADVHGKNHHRDGGFGQFVDWIDLVGTDGTVTRCSREENRELLDWTIGGMGLTGIIVRAAIRLRPVETGWIRQTTIPLPNLDAAMQAFERSESATYSVAWIDCLSAGSKLGRSLLMLGEHAAQEDLPRACRAKPYETPRRRKVSVAVDLPGGFLNRYSVRAFNWLYYWNGERTAGDHLVDWDSYFYPLDSILNWNKIYGRRGLIQFQCVLPLESGERGLTALLQATSSAGEGSFLAVLKRFGAQESRFSFPMLGYTLALDFPANRRTLELMTSLDRIVVEHGGRFYLAKDARMPTDILEQSDKRVADFVAMRQERMLRAGFRSEQSERLGL